MKPSSLQQQNKGQWMQMEHTKFHINMRKKHFHVEIMFYIVNIVTTDFFLLLAAILIGTTKSFCFLLLYSLDYYSIKLDLESSFQVLWCFFFLGVCVCFCLIFMAFRYSLSSHSILHWLILDFPSNIASNFR